MWNKHIQLRNLKINVWALFLCYISLYQSLHISQVNKEIQIIAIDLI